MRASALAQPSRTLTVRTRAISGNGAWLRRWFGAGPESIGSFAVRDVFGRPTINASFGSTTTNQLNATLGMTWNDAGAAFDGNVRVMLSEGWVLVPKALASAQFTVRNGGNTTAVMYVNNSPTSLGPSRAFGYAHPTPTPQTRELDAAGFAAVYVRLYGMDDYFAGGSVLQWNIGAGNVDVPQNRLLTGGADDARSIDDLLRAGVGVTTTSRTVTRTADGQYRETNGTVADLSSPLIESIL